MYTGKLPSIRPDVPVALHTNDHERWYSLGTPSNRFIRIGSNEYYIACLLDGQRSAADIVKSIRESDERCEVNESEVLKVVQWLGVMGLLANDQGGVPASPGNPIFYRHNLIAGKTMERIGKAFLFATHRYAIGAAVCIWIAAALVSLGNWQEMLDFCCKLVVADSLIYCLLAWVVLKLLHEIGHAAFAVRYRCRIHSAGICWMFFTPIPFVDISGMWLNTNRWQRCTCCLGGLYFEFTISSLAVLLFASSSSEVVRYVCCLLFSLGTISTVVINANPLIKSDGYHFLSEWLSWPNLYADGQQAMWGLLWKFLNPWYRSTRSIQIILALYGVLCLSYRFLFWTVLLIGAYVTLHALGVLLMIAVLYLYMVYPRLRKLWHDFSVKHAAQRSSASFWQAVASQWHLLLWISTVSILVIVGVCWLPSPWRPMVPGVVGYSHPYVLRNETDGFVQSVLVGPGARVHKGQVLAVLDNPVLESERQLKVVEVTALREQAMLLQARGELAHAQSIRAKLEAAEDQLSQLERRCGNLSVQSPCDGRLVDWQLSDRLGQFLESGNDIGLVTESDHLEVVGFVEQTDIDRFEQGHYESLQVRLPMGEQVIADIAELVPRASDQLESPQLAALYGGPLTVKQAKQNDGPTELKMLKPRFKVRATLQEPHSQYVRPGQTVGVYLPRSQGNLLQYILRLGEQTWHHYWQKNSAKYQDSL